jgi:hypothetical protein
MVITAATTEGNANICDDIKNREDRTYIKCITSVASSKADHSVCAKLEEPGTNIHQDEIDECYYLVGYYHYKASACSSVKKEEIKNKCLLKVAEHNADTDICDERMQTTELKDKCYMQIAFSQDHDRYCSEIQDSNVKSECKKHFE